MSIADEGGQLRVLGIAGSLRSGSYNRSLLEAAIELAPEGMEVERFEGLGRLPLFNGDFEADGTHGGPDVADFKQRIARADALLIATPEYNYSIPGVLKNAIDWASRPPRSNPLRFKPVAIMGTSEGMWGTVRAQLALRQSLLFLRAPVMSEPEILVPDAPSRFDADGRLTDEVTRGFLADFMVAFADWARRLAVEPEGVAAG